LIPGRSIEVIGDTFTVVQVAMEVDLCLQGNLFSQDSFFHDLNLTGGWKLNVRFALILLSIMNCNIMYCLYLAGEC